MVKRSHKLNAWLTETPAAGNDSPHRHQTISHLNGMYGARHAYHLDLLASRPLAEFPNLGVHEIAEEARG